MGDRYMTMGEIEAAYPNEWVLLHEPKPDRYNSVAGARVLFHHPDYDRVYEEALRVPVPRNIGVVFTGPPDEDVVFAL